ncbi:MAG: DUF2779 domain-containing protein [Candidatus Margulisbacteria bacterium]|jgi:hypothetical protein|nr:DUF2779 domain-containing protein [Candidatus Margulisiibacteriota bacterium]
MAVLSKSKYLVGLQCPKLLWYQYHRKSELPPPSPFLEGLFAEGHKVGALAQQLFPGGILLERDLNPHQQDARSFAALAARQPLFEAGFLFENAYALADILLPVGDDEWDLIEVKSSTKVKDDHYRDIAFQKYVYTNRGLKIRQTSLMFMNREYVRHGALDLKQLFTQEELSEGIEPFLGNIAAEIAQLQALIAGPEPTTAVGKQCSEECPLYDRCWKFLPEGHVFILRGQRTVAFDLMERGVLKLQDIPADFELNEKHTIQVESHRTKAPFVDQAALRDFLGQLKYPYYYLDFETIAPPVPIYDGTRPYEDVPFQFSLHIVAEEGAKPVHHAFLAPGDVDPRPEVLRQLRDLIKPGGSIIAYNADYEKGRIKMAAAVYPEYHHWYQAIKDDFVDLLVPFKKFFYYHPAQGKSASMKEVLPALTGITYDGLEIGEGGLARYEYMRVTYGENIADADRQKVRAALEKYCELDTRAMIEILQVLKEAV